MTQTLSTNLLNRKQAAEFLGISVGTLEVWAATKRYNLPYIKVGRLANYRLSDLQQFIESRRVNGQPE